MSSVQSMIEVSKHFEIPPMYIFILKVEKDRSSLVLVNDGTVQAAYEWPESRDMGQKLYQAIDETLAAQGLKAEDISEFTVETDLPESYTSVRIAETVARVYTYGVRALKSVTKP